MKIPRLIKWGFDPLESGVAALSTKTGRLVWSVIRVNHIVDQHFSDDVELFASAFDKRPKNTVDELFDLARRCDLDRFGSANLGGRDRGLVRDDEWWGELLDALHGRIDVAHAVIKETS